MADLSIPSPRSPAAGFLFQKLIVLTIALTLVGTIPAVADLNPRLYGTVADSSGLPLTSAHVTIAELQTGTATDWIGQYRLYDLSPGTYTLTVSHLGYKTSTKYGVTVYEDAPTCVNFILTTLVLKEPIAVVRAQKSPLYFSHDQKVNITSNVWRTNGAASIGEAMREIPGISVLEGDGSQRLSLRGSSSRNVRVDLDGIPLNDAGTGEAEVGHIDLDQLASIQVEFEGIGGKVHLLTTDFSKTDGSNYKTTVSAAHGSYGKNDFGVGFNGKSEWLSTGIQYKQKFNKGDFKYQLDDGRVRNRVNNQSKSSSGISKIIYDRASWAFDCGAYYEEVRRGIPGLTYVSPTPEAALHNKRLSARIGLKGKTALISYSMAGFISDYSSHYISPKFQYNPETGTTVQQHEENNRQSGFRYGLLTNSKLDLKQGRLHLDYGFQVDSYKGEDLVRNRVTVGGVGFGDAHRTTNRIELGGRWWGKRLGIRCHLNPNLALENIHDAGNQSYVSTSPSINIAFEKSFKSCLLSLLSGWGRSLSAPPFNALFLVENAFAVGNKDLRPESGECFYAGFAFSSLGTLELSPWRFSLTSSRRTVEDLIIWQRNSQSKYYPSNVDRVKIHSIEINGSVYPFKSSILLFGSYIYNKSVNDMPNDINYGKLTPLSAKHSGSISVTITYWNTILNVRGRWVGRRYSTEANTDYMSTAGRGLPPYTVYDINLTREFKLKRVILTSEAGIDNLLDESYRVIERTPMPGRTYNLKLGLSI